MQDLQRVDALQQRHRADEARLHRRVSNAGDFGLLYYNARWSDPALGRFDQADSIVPEGVQGYDRYAYVRNSPISLTDPTGH